MHIERLDKPWMQMIEDRDIEDCKYHFKAKTVIPFEYKDDQDDSGIIEFLELNYRSQIEKSFKEAHQSKNPKTFYVSRICT